MSDGIEIKRTYCADQEVTRLLGIIAQALAAMDRSEYGQARRILKTGADTAVKAVTGVLARYSL